METSEFIWNKIVDEASLVMKNEPILSNFLFDYLLQHHSLGSALSYLLSKKLGNASISATVIRDIIEESYVMNPKIIDHAVYDICISLERDPVIDTYSTLFLYFKGFHALQAYRVGNWLWYHNRRSLAVYFQSQISFVFGVDIHPAARIGHGIIMDHATGIVIGETAVVQNNVSILQSVTLGSTGKEGRGDRHPKIGENVIIGAGAIVLGNIEIGCGAKIGAGSVVLHSVPSYVTVSGIAARIVNNFDIK